MGNINRLTRPCQSLQRESKCNIAFKKNIGCLNPNPDFLKESYVMYIYTWLAIANFFILKQTC